jgi:hypothetical protein
MKAKAQEHLAHGRLLRIKVEYRDFIEKVEIRGDVEFEPPEAVSEIEKCLVDIEVISSVEGIANLIEDTLSAHHASMHGASSFDIARVVKKATGNR